MSAGPRAMAARAGVRAAALAAARAARLAAAVTATLAAALPVPLAGQVSSPARGTGGVEVEVVPGADYSAGGLQRLLAGANHRVLWVRPLRVPVLDLDRFGGGLEVSHEGGNQTRVLHLEAADGRRYLFRSIAKYTDKILPDDLVDTWTHELVQDHMSAFHPSGALVAPAFNRSLGLLAAPGELRVMPDHPGLGEFRARFAGMLGQVVERPDEGEDEEPLFHGYTRIISTERLLERMDEHPRHRVDAREYLAARLIDFLLGDPDRGPDQWRWARDQEAQGFRWRPIARDRDWTFFNADGLLASGFRAVFPKLVEFGPRLPSVEALTFADQGLGPRLLAGLDRVAWEEVTAGVVAGITDAAIDHALDLLPPEHRADQAASLAATLRARRHALPGLARAFYRDLALAAEVRGTDRNDRAEVARAADGSVRVTLLAAADGMRPLWTDEDDAAHEADVDVGDPRAHLVPYFDRTFLPGETREVRLFLGGGDDVAIVRGSGASPITVRIVGGDGDDRLEDRADGGRTVLYDDAGENAFRAGRSTRVDTRPYSPPDAPADFFAEELSRPRTAGSRFSRFRPVVGYEEGGGLVVGGGPSRTTYGFRREPYATSFSLQALVGTRTGGLGVAATGDVRRENSALGLRLDFRATDDIDAVRFYGVGNDAPRVDPSAALILLRQVTAGAAIVYRGDRVRAGLGPLFRWTRPRVPDASPVWTSSEELPPGLGRTTETGAAAELELLGAGRDPVPDPGWSVSARASAFPGARAGAWGRADIEARAYVPVPVPEGAVLALRLGGRRGWGEVPLRDMARLGGSATLRGYRWHRFAGDEAVYGGAELRVPLVRANLGLARGRLGVLVLGDAGRVWADGASPAGWHTGHGAGLFFATLGTAVNLVWGRGEEDRVYVGMGMPF